MLFTIALAWSFFTAVDPWLTTGLGTLPDGVFPL